MQLDRRCHGNGLVGGADLPVAPANLAGNSASFSPRNG